MLRHCLGRCGNAADLRVSSKLRRLVRVGLWFSIPVTRAASTSVDDELEKFVEGSQRASSTPLA